MKGLQLKIKKSSLLYLLAIIIIAEPDFIGTINWLDNTLYNYGAPIVFLILIFLSVRRHVFDGVVGTILLFYCHISVMTLFRGGDLTQLVIALMKIVSYVLLINYGIKRRGCDFLRIIGRVFYIYAVINLFSMIFFPRGLYNFEALEHSWFLGHKNNMIKWLLPGLVFVSLPDLLQKKKLSFGSWLYIVIFGVTEVLGKSSTSLIAICILGFCIIASLREWKISKFINSYTAIIINITFFISVVIFRVQEIASRLIVGFFGKTLEFTGRTALWDRLLLAVSVHPILGNGISDANSMRALLQYTNTSAHNLMLDYLYASGIIGVTLFFIILIIADKRMKGINEKNSVYFLRSNLLAFSIVWNMDTFMGVNMMHILALVIVIANMIYLTANRQNIG